MAISAADLLEGLENRGVRFEVPDGRLRVFAPKDVLTEDLRQQLRDHREEIIGLVARRRIERPDGQVPPITVADRGGRLPLSFSQQRLWFLDRLEPGSVEYNVPMPVR